MANEISVICTVKNGEKTIKNTISSVMNQTFNEFEIIVIDDGSEDSTLNILRNIKKIYPKLRIVKTKGIGRSEALNLAITKSMGLYIANIDADDVWHPRKLEIQYKMMKDNPDIFLIGTLSKIFYSDDLPIWKNTSDNIFMKPIKFKLLIRNPIMHSSVLMNKNKVKNLGMYNTQRESQVDYELWLRALQDGLKMVNIEEELVGKRIHKDQSYENKKRLLYIKNSIILQIKYILKSKKIWILPIAFLRFIFGLLPFKTRQNIKQLITN